MGARSLGSITLDLILKVGGLTAGMNKGERDLNKGLSAMEKRAQTFGKTLGIGIKAAASAATVALGALSIAVGKAIDNADEIRDLSIRLGVSTESLSTFGYAAEQTGTDLDTLGRGLKILAKNAADAQKSTSEQAKVFDALGISVTGADGKLKSLEDLLPQIATQFKGLEDGTTKTALALSLFGKSGTDLIEFLNQGEDGLKTLTDRARALGVEIDSNTAKAADDFNDTLNELKTIVAGGSLTIAKELLPALQEAAEDLKRFASEGELASNAATVLGGALKVGVGTIDAYNSAVRYTGIALEALIPLMLGVNEAARNMGPQGLFVDGSVVGGLKKASQGYKDAQASMVAYWEEQDRREAKANGLFADVTARVLPGASTVNEKAIQRAVGGVAGGSGKATKAGKSDAQKEAEETARALREAAQAQYEWHQQILDMQASLEGPTAEVTREYQKQMEELDGQFAAGNIKLADYAKAQDLITQKRDVDLKKIDDQLTPYEEVNAAIQEQIKLLGMSAEQQEVYNNLKAAGVESNTAFGQSIVQTTEELQRAREAQASMDDLKDASRDLFANLIDGSMSAKDAFGDFADELLRMSARVLADKAVQSLFSMFDTGMPTGAKGDVAIGAGSYGGAAGGSWWQSILSAWGGGRAGGGSVLPGKFYRVNESGMEMATVDGRDYLMTGSKTAYITPNHRLGGGGLVQNIKFETAAPTSQRTQEQIAQRAGFEVAQVQRRNG